MSRTRLSLVTFAVMLGLFLSAVELTVVGTAMPTIISQLGGLTLYSWVFSVYSLASTTMTPILGKLSDQFGRRPVYLAGMGVFLAGSALSGLAQSMPQLILFRAIQGLGAGALIPIGFTIVGDIYTVEQRARIQGLFSGVWGVASLIGPLVGGFLVDNASWRWVFYVNIPFGVLAMGIIIWGLREPDLSRHGVQVDLAGAGWLAASTVSLLLFMLEGDKAWPWLSAPSVGLFAVFLVAFVLFLRAERRAPDPILNLDLFRDRVFSVTFGHGLLVGLSLFGLSSFIPLFAQGVLGMSATAAGATLTPQLIGWVITSTFGAPLILRFGYRPMVVGGMIIAGAGAAVLAFMGGASTQFSLGVSQFLMGAGNGIGVTALLIAIQNRVPRNVLGAATSARSFSLQIGGAVGVSLMGAVMASRLLSGLASVQTSVPIKPESLLDPHSAANIPPEALDAVRAILGHALEPVFYIAFVGALVGLAVSLLIPRGSVQDLAGDDEPPLRHREVGEPLAPQPAGADGE